MAIDHDESGLLHPIETVTIRGFGRRRAIANTMAGCFLLFLVVFLQAFLFAFWAQPPSEMLLALLLVWSMTAYFLGVGLLAARVRELTVSENGVEIRVGRGKPWTAAWSEVSSVGAGHSETEGIPIRVYIRVRGYEKELLLKQSFGPLGRLKDAFEALARAAPEGVAVEDRLGWHPSLREGSALNALPRPDLMGVWHTAVDPKRERRDALGVLVGLPAIFLVSLWITAGVVEDSSFESLGLALPVMVGGVLVPTIVLWLLATPRELRYTREGLSLRYRGRRPKEWPWTSVYECNKDVATNGLLIVYGRGAFRPFAVKCYPPAEVKDTIIRAFEATHHYRKEALPPASPR